MSAPHLVMDPLRALPAGGALGADTLICIDGADAPISPSPDGPRDSIPPPQWLRHSDVPDPLDKSAMKFVQMFGEPLVLFVPVRLVVRVNVATIVCYPAIAGRRRLVTPFERMAQFILDVVFLSFE